MENYNNNINHNNMGGKNAASSFEEVDIDTFIGGPTVNSQLLGNKANINETIAKMKDKTAVSGVIALLNEELNFRSFQRGLEVMSIANCERHLQIIESAFQTTIKEIKECNASGSPYWNDKKTSLYLYTLQHLILNLDKFELPNNQRNTYKPKLVQKLQDIKFQCVCLGVSNDLIRSQCFTKAYQQPYNKDLRNFEFIDEDRLDAFNSRLKKFSVTRNPSDLYNVNESSQARSTAESVNTLQKIIKHIEAKFNLQELDLKTYMKHCFEINEEIIRHIGTNDLAVIYNLTDALTQYLEANERFKNDGRTM